MLYIYVCLISYKISIIFSLKMLKNTILGLSVFVMFVELVTAQRGGGGGSSGGSSYSGGGGSSYSGGTTYYGGGYGGYGYGGYGYNSGYYGNRYYGGSGQSSTAGIVVGSVFGALCLGGAGCLICRHCGRRGCCKGDMYKKLQKEYNAQAGDSGMSEEQFRAKRDRILYLINKSQDGNNFALEQVTEKHPMRAMAVIVKQQPYLTELKMTGSDKFGSWRARGFILPRHGQPFLWFYKEYDNKQAAGQTDEWQDLIYESQHYDDRNGMEGRWFYHGHEMTAEFSGKWKLWEPVGGYAGGGMGNQYGGYGEPVQPYFS